MRVFLCFQWKIKRIEKMRQSFVLPGGHFHLFYVHERGRRLLYKKCNKNLLKERRDIAKISKKIIEIPLGGSSSKSNGRTK